jgi:rhodanese-related sulfurtransferase
MDVRITSAALRQSLQSPHPPLVIDVRRNERFYEATDFVAGALRCDPLRVDTLRERLQRPGELVLYCVHGHEVSQDAARVLGARYLEGGIEGWRESGGELLPKPAHAATRWVTRERPKIDRIACPWLVRRFVDPDAEFLYVPDADVMKVAQEKSAIPYDVPGVRFSHDGERCSFDAFLRAFRLQDPALDALALIVRGADTARLELAPQAAGLAAISLGLSINFLDDLALLEHGMVVYDALYAWCRKGRDEVHAWRPEAHRAA